MKSAIGISADRKTGLKFIDVNKKAARNPDLPLQMNNRIASNSPIDMAGKINSSGYVTNLTRYTKANESDGEEISVQLKINARSMSKLLAFSGLKVNKHAPANPKRLSSKQVTGDIESELNEPQVTLKIDPAQQYKKAYKKEGANPARDTRKSNTRVHPQIKRKVQNIITANATPIADILQSRAMSPKQLEESLETIIQADIQDKIATKIAE